MNNKLVLIRHGQSVSNLCERFTGWGDSPLTKKGAMQARTAGQKLKAHGIEFDRAYASLLQRTIHSANIILRVCEQEWIPFEKSWRLNERHYGALQGMRKAVATERFGKEQVSRWRRGFSDRPPPLGRSKYSSLWADRRYHDIPRAELPNGESAEDTEKRLWPIWSQIQSKLELGENILIVSHGNTLRALVRVLENLTLDQFEALDIDTGVPRIYEFDRTTLGVGRFRVFHEPKGVKQTSANERGAKE